MPGAKNKQTNEEELNGKKAGAEGGGATGDEGDETDAAKKKAAGSADDDAGGDDFADPAKALAEIKKLRAENAKHRTKNKSLEEQMGKVNGTMTKLKSALGIESEDEDPETQVATLKQQNEALQMQAALSQLCEDNEIPSKGKKYFNFLIAQEFETLDEGEEISEERIAEIAKETKKMFLAGGSTGVDASGKAKDPDAATGSVSAAQFAKMNVGEKSALYSKDSALYQKLFTEAKEKRLL